MTLCSSVKQIKVPYLFFLKRHYSARNAGESDLISQRGGSFMVFLELRHEPGLHSRVTAGVAINNFCFFSATLGLVSS